MTKIIEKILDTEDVTEIFHDFQELICFSVTWFRIKERKSLRKLMKKHLLTTSAIFSLRLILRSTEVTRFPSTSAARDRRPAAPYLALRPVWPKMVARKLVPCLYRIYTETKLIHVWIYSSERTPFIIYARTVTGAWKIPIYACNWGQVKPIQKR